MPYLCFVSRLLFLSIKFYSSLMLWLLSEELEAILLEVWICLSMRVYSCSEKDRLCGPSTGSVQQCRKSREGNAFEIK